MAEATQRIDKWLWHARFAKTRTVAQKLVSGGNVRLDREKITNNSQKVKAGQVLTLSLPRDVKIVKIVAFAEKRGSFQIAQTLYEDLTPVPEKPATKEFEPDKNAPIVDDGRPSKHQRKQLLKLKRGNEL